MIRLMVLFCSLILIQCVSTQIIKVQPPGETANTKSSNNNKVIPSEEMHIIRLNSDTNLGKQEAPHVKPDLNKANVAMINISEPTHQQKKQNVQLQNDTAHTLDTDQISIPKGKIPQLQKDNVQYGPLLRGFYVFISLSAVVLIYLGFRSYRIRRNTQSSVKVKKYGVVTRRNDIEMRRLELEEEEDDENLFDIQQHRQN